LYASAAGVLVPIGVEAEALPEALEAILWLDGFLYI
jgi:hypothetical protein